MPALPEKPMHLGTASLPIRVTSGSTVLVEAELSVPIMGTARRSSVDPLKVEITTSTPELRSALASFFGALSEEFRTEGP